MVAQHEFVDLYLVKIRVSIVVLINQNTETCLKSVIEIDDGETPMRILML